MGNVLPAGPISNPQLKPCGKPPYNFPGSFGRPDREPGRIYPAKGNGVRILSTNVEDPPWRVTNYPKGADRGLSVWRRFVRTARAVIDVRILSTPAYPAGAS